MGRGGGAQGANLTPQGTDRFSKTCRRAVMHPCAFVDIKASEAGSDFAEEMKEDGAGSGGVGNYCGSGGPAFLPIV
jgi:hypothetical protein